MARYTITLKDMLKITQLFDFEYTWTVTTMTKDQLEEMITDHYYLYEIGAETITRFKQFFKAKFKENLIEFQQRLNKYNSLMETQASTDKRIYHEVKSLDDTTSILSPPMSNAPSNTRYSSEREIKNNELTTEGWETIPETEYFEKVYKRIKPIVLEFIESLRDCFMTIF